MTARRRLVDLSPLRVSPAFARLWIGSAVTGIGTQLTVVAVGLQVYALTHSTLAVSLVGGVALLPMILAGLWGGMLADVFDRRRVLLVSTLVGWIATLAIAGLSFYYASAGGGSILEIVPLYVATTVNSVAGTVSGATRTSVYPRILPLDKVPAAAALSGISLGIQLTAGPALAGILVAAVGLPVTFLVDVVLFTAGFLGVVTLPRLRPLSEPSRPGLAAVLDGLRFLRRAPNIRAGFLIDLVAMTLGRPYVLLPAAGALVVGGGAVTVGVLTAAAATGTFLASLFSGPVSHTRRYGIAIGGAVIVYGGFIGLFGLVLLLAQLGALGPAGADWSQVNWTALVLAGIALMGTGAADEVSAIFRSSMLLTAAPDEMRGRLQGIFTVVVTGGPRLGDLYAGVLTSLVALWFPPLLGGLLIMLLVATLLRLLPGFRAYDADDPRP
ncbi:MFS transporter [Gulosibacter sp. 10]|uniref:MFS transporter n=1 Tax=Gulosibacter sp. 10 TaxID=1255570 RepID=UPI00097EB28C|nr:MFS transporter [Gulosibacter sp. 10]SJM60453.1 major facilitator superfamily MFS_1 [Gulosibacter sp. 10]